MADKKAENTATKEKKADTRKEFKDNKKAINEETKEKKFKDDKKAINEEAKEKKLGVAVPVGALRGQDSAGAGEFLDLVEFARLCVQAGVGLIQLLPVNDTGYESSPYSALSAFALNPLYIKLTCLEEAAGFEARIAELRAKFDGAERFPYYEVATAKVAILREMFAARKAVIQKDAALQDWIRLNEWIKVYAVFRSLKEAEGLRHWKEWGRHGHVTREEIEALWSGGALEDEHLFWAWVQFKLDAQFRAAKQEIAKLGLMLEGDLPILINEDSADVWAHPAYFDNAYSAGAPPDIYSPAGQNWGFPIYNWAALEKDGYSWWKARLSSAEKYFDAYRIDHVLGFFRIWATARNERDALLGRFIPVVPIKRADLEERGYDEGRRRWLSLPHIPTEELMDAVFGAGGSVDDVRHISEAALDRIGSEELWLFKEAIRSGNDIAALAIHDAGKRYLLAAWNNRVFYEYEAGNYVPVWYYHNARAWASLQADEKNDLEALINEKREKSEKKWAAEGEKLLSMLKAASAMLPCAEDLGAVPDCVPVTLEKLGILGLRVVRWTRRWEESGQPFIPFAEYPELSVCTPAVHDSSTVREWWEREADQNGFAAFIGCPSLSKVYNPGTAGHILRSAAASASRFRVFQIQDLLHLSPAWYAKDPASERINVPGSANDFNWTYRLPAPISEIMKDEELIKRIKELSTVQGAR
jgi:4-alpha-glucanotransferase